MTIQAKVSAAQTALDTHTLNIDTREYLEGDVEEQMIALLTNLRHLAHDQQLDFASMTQSSIRRFRTEQEEG